jgi:hypothetical protein
MKKIFVVLLLLTSFACAQTPLDDAKKDPALYKVSFTVMEIQNGQRSNVRNYSMYLPANARTHSTRVGNRVPVPVGKDNGIQYMDVGLNMNCSIILEKTDGVVIEFNFDLGSLIAPDNSTPEHVPVVRQLRQDGVAFLPAGKATQIASADDTNTTRTVVVEATATKVK